MRYSVFVLVLSAAFACKHEGEGKTSKKMAGSNEPVAVSTADASTTDASKPITTEEQSANELYVSDVVESAETTDTATEKTPPAKADDSVKDDRAPRRRGQMANMLFDDLDADDSGTLSKDEFKKLPKPKHGLKAKGQDRLDKDFAEHAGEDGELSLEELAAMLEAKAPRVGELRKMRGKPEHERRQKLAWSEIIAKFDEDGDEKLNQAEFEAIQQAQQGMMERWKGREARRGPAPRGDRGEAP